MSAKEIYNSTLKAGKRTYFFDGKRTIENKKYLQITESKSIGEGEFKRNQILIFEEDAEEFLKQTLNALLPLVKNEVSTTPDHTSAYKPWSKEDDAKLERLYCEKMSVAEISVIFRRNQGAIRSRIKKLELRDKYN